MERMASLSRDEMMARLASVSEGSGRVVTCPVILLVPRLLLTNHTALTELF